MSTPLTSGQHLPEKVFDLQYMKTRGCQPSPHRTRRSFAAVATTRVRLGDAALSPKAIEAAALPSDAGRSTALEEWDLELPVLMLLTDTFLHSPFPPLGCEKRDPDYTFLGSWCPAQNTTWGSGNICCGENQILGGGRSQDVCRT